MIKYAFICLYLGKPKQIDLQKFVFDNCLVNEESSIFLITDCPDEWAETVNDKVTIVTIKGAEELYERGKKYGLLNDGAIDELRRCTCPNNIVCGMKPFYWLLFPEVVEGYTHFGWYDNDTVFRVTDDLNVQDKIYFFRKMIGQTTFGLIETFKTVALPMVKRFNDRIISTPQRKSRRWTYRFDENDFKDEVNRHKMGLTISKKRFHDKYSEFEWTEIDVSEKNQVVLDRSNKNQREYEITGPTTIRVRTLR
jgi:hypothetical protein